MSCLKEIYEILQLCLRILSKLYGNYGIFFRGGVERYTSYEVYSTKCCLCCGTLQLPVEIKILDPELFLNGSV